MKSSFRFVHRALIVLSCTAVLIGANLALNSTHGAAEAAQVTSSNNSTPNWAGYVVTGKTYSKVQGDITVPAITCTASGAESLFWVGLDGYNTKTTEQDGVGAKCVGTTPSYFVWWEMYNPATGSLHQVSTSVKPGQKIDASVTYVAVKESNGKTVYEYDLQLDNASTNQKMLATDQPCPSGYSCGRSTAEWIAERYNKGNNSFLPLGKWSYNAHLFTDSYATANSKLAAISGNNNVSVGMIDSNYNFLADPSSLNTGGTSFGVQWSAAE